MRLDHSNKLPRRDCVSSCLAEDDARERLSIRPRALA
jgi:hypothetical protein